MQIKLNMIVNKERVGHGGDDTGFIDSMSESIKVISKLKLTNRLMKFITLTRNMLIL